MLGQFESREVEANIILAVKSINDWHKIINKIPVGDFIHWNLLAVEIDNYINKNNKIFPIENIVAFYPDFPVPTAALDLDFWLEIAVKNILIAKTRKIVDNILNNYESEPNLTATEAIDAFTKLNIEATDKQEVYAIGDADLTISGEEEPTGIITLDKAPISLRWRKGQHILLAGQTGVGKSFVALQCCVEKMKNRHKVLYIGPDMDAIDIEGRLRKMIAPEFFPYFRYVPSLGNAISCNKIDTWIQMYGVEFCVIDILPLIVSATDKEISYDWKDLLSTAGRLSMISKRRKTTLLSLGVTTGSEEYLTNPPNLGGIGLSRQMEHHFDCIISMSLNTMDEDEKRKIMIIKDRSGSRRMSKPVVISFVVDENRIG